MSREPDYKRGTLYLRLETDEEFRARLRAQGVTSLVVETKVERSSFYGGTYVDIERKAVMLANLRGAELDECAWAGIKVQRKLVEDGKAGK